MQKKHYTLLILHSIEPAHLATCDSIPDKLFRGQIIYLDHPRKFWRGVISHTIIRAL